MTADIILILKQGRVHDQHIVLHTDVAEAVVDSIMEDLIGEDYEEIRPHGGDYNTEEFNRYLKPLGMEIVWLTEVKVNTYENGED